MATQAELDSLEAALLTNASGPAEAQNDMGRMKQHPLPDQIAAAEHLAGNTAVATRRRGLRYAKFIPPGAT